MRSVRDNTRTSVRAGHKVSKSNLAASLAIWWAMGPPGSRVLITASTGSQIRDIIWREIQDMKRNAKVILPGKLNKMPANGWDLGQGRQIVGRSSDDPEGIAGISSPRLLIIADEASGIDDDIFSALDGNMAGGAHILLLGNPTKITGYFFDSFHMQKDIWNCFCIPSTESPNVKAGEVIIPGLATKEWVEDRLRAWGPNDPRYRVRVLGEFADTSIDSLIRREWIEAAFKRHDEWVAAGKPGKFQSFGADPASADGPDAAVMVPCYDVGPESIERFANIGPLDLADKIVDEYRSRGNKGTAIVDVLSGPGTADSLKRQNVPCQPYKGSEKTDWTDHYGYSKFKRVRVAAYWKLRDGLNPETGIDMILPRNEALLRQLILLEWWEDTTGHICITTKDDWKSLLGGKSPDEADGVAMAWWFDGNKKRVPAYRIMGG
jgi:phage terminase large subunit